MNIIDIIILLCCIPAVFHGLGKGFVAQVAATAALIAGAWLSFKFSGIAVGWLKPYIDLPDGTLQVIAFALILIVVFLALTLVGKLLEGMIKIVMLGWLNKLLGVAFALLKTALIIGLLVILVDTVLRTMDLETPELLKDSVLYGPCKEFADWFFPYFKELITNL